MNGHNKTVTLTTIIMLARGFDMTPSEFLNDTLPPSSCPKIWKSNSKAALCKAAFIIKITLVKCYQASKAKNEFESKKAKSPGARPAFRLLLI